MRTKGVITIMVLMTVVGAACSGDAYSLQRAAEKLGDVPATMLEAGETYTFGEREAVADIGGAYVIGEKDAPVTIAVFADFQCQFCARSHVGTQAVRQELLRNGVIRMVHLDFPLALHNRSEDAAAFARCSGRVAGAAAFWQTYSALYEMQTMWSGWSSAEEAFRRMAESIDVPWDEVSACMDSGDEEAAIDRFRKLGFRVGVRGTPTSFFNGVVRVGALDAELFQALVDEAQRPASGAPGSRH